MATESAHLALVWPDDRDLIQAVIPGEAELAAAILSQNLIDRALIDENTRRYRDSLVVKQHLADHIKKSVTADSVRKHYEDNKAKYVTRHYVADIIYLPTGNTEEDYVREEKRRLLQEVIASLVTGTSLEDLRDNFSESGMLFKSGEFSDSDLAPELTENLKKMTINDSVGPIETADGFYILHLTAINEETPTYESVMNSIWYERVEKAKEEEINRLLAVFRGQI